MDFNDEVNYSVKDYNILSLE